jgi:hypothetical protein
VVVMTMVLLTVLEGPLLISLDRIGWLLGVHVSSYLELIQMDCASGESVRPLLLDVVVGKSLVGHTKVLVNNQVSVETFEKDCLWMKKRFHNMLLTIIHPLLRFFVGLSTSIFTDTNIIKSIIFWIVLVSRSSLESKL